MRQQTSIAERITNNINIQKITLERINQGLSISQLAEMAGVSKSAVSTIERGLVRPRSYIIGRVVKALGKNIEHFIEEE